MARNQHIGKVVHIEPITPLTWRFFIEVQGVNEFIFQPGQFVTLELPIDEKPARRMRSYSIASAPNGTNVFELCIVYLEGGLGTQYLFNYVKVGDLIPFFGPLGHFTLPENMQQDIFFICTGTGIAPFRSMLHFISNHRVPHQNLWLIFGTRTRDNLLYFDEMKSIEEQLSTFQYHPVLSREQWEGHTGYVHGVYDNILSRQLQDVNKIPYNALYYLCGWRDMINEARTRLQHYGVSKDQIRLELYG